MEIFPENILGNDNALSAPGVSGRRNKDNEEEADDEKR